MMFNMDDETIRRVFDSGEPKCDINAPIREENFLEACMRGAEKIDDEMKAKLQNVLGTGRGI